MKANRPPVVAVLGHVDHGKTTLLDAIRKTNIAAREVGGITQKIGAYQIEVLGDAGSRKITFIDTPGHEAFLAMRSRGVAAADIAILVIAANEGIKPQTKESIKHIKEAKLPVIVALTKSDLPDIKEAKLKQELAREEILVEELGGDVPAVLVSAKTNKGIKELLETILLVWDMQEHKDKIELQAIVIEAKLDPKKGILVTLVIKSGELKVADEVFAGSKIAKIRAIINFQGKNINLAQAGDAVEVLGWTDIPSLGDIVGKEKQEIKDKEETNIQTAGSAALSIILKADNMGAVEAILLQLPQEVRIVSASTGIISEGDITRAKAHSAIVIAFNVKVGTDTAKFAQDEGVLIKQYSLIYELLDEIKEAASGLLEIKAETILGKAQILASFPFEKTKVLGIRVTEGRVALGDKIRLMRKDETIGESTIRSIRKGKESINVADSGSECGVILGPALDFEVGDMLLSYHL